MTSHGGTGSTVPAWVRERIRRLEDDWPPRALAAALAGVILAVLFLLGVLCSADAPVYYARP